MPVNVRRRYDAPIKVHSRVPPHHRAVTLSRPPTSIQLILTIISHFSHRFPIATVELGPKHLGTMLFERERFMFSISRANAVAIALDGHVAPRYLCRPSCVPALFMSHPMPATSNRPARTGQACMTPVNIQCMRIEDDPCG